jgi:hypothetical protein
MMTTTNNPPARRGAARLDLIVATIGPQQSRRGGGLARSGTSGTPCARRQEAPGPMGRGAAIMILVRATLCGSQPRAGGRRPQSQLARASRLSSQYAAIRSLP